MPDRYRDQLFSIIGVVVTGDAADARYSHGTFNNFRWPALFGWDAQGQTPKRNAYGANINEPGSQALREVSRGAADDPRGCREVSTNSSQKASHDSAQTIFDP
jgi:hypothetical protein